MGALPPLHRRVRRGEIAEALGLAQNLVSHDLRALSEGGLIRSDRQGRMVFDRLDEAELPKA